ncbi:MAG TPA: hypothetical protein VGF61_13090 [Candidatus Acidoferrum sp.]|jgi:hypothetical protein
MSDVDNISRARLRQMDASRSFQRALITWSAARSPENTRAVERADAELTVARENVIEATTRLREERKRAIFGQRGW